MSETETGMAIQFQKGSVCRLREFDPSSYDWEEWEILLNTYFKGITGFSGVINLCLQNESLGFIEKFSKSFVVNYMNEFDKSNDHNGFFTHKLKGLFSSSNIRNLNVVFLR